jgi:hypothetical protein
MNSQKNASNTQMSSSNKHPHGRLERATERAKEQYDHSISILNLTLLFSLLLFIN